MSLRFQITARDAGSMARAGEVTTPHGVFKTPCFVPVATKATVKALTPEQMKALHAEVTLANTYHLYLAPGEARVKKGGGLAKYMAWNGPTFTDSGGFQAFSLGEAFGKKLGKIAAAPTEEVQEVAEKPIAQMAKVTEDGVEFKSVLDGSTHFFTPEKSIQIQHDIGADIIFVFDECTSPHAPKEYQIEALNRTNRWAIRCIDEHKKLNDIQETKQALFGIVQGGRYADLRKSSAEAVAAMDFDGFGIGGSFDKEDIGTGVRYATEHLPENKPRHLLGIGEPLDMLDGIAAGCDTFDCVAPTRRARNGSLYTKDGMINIFNTRFQDEYEALEKDCDCYTCKNFTKSYLAHLYRADELLANTLGTIHNVRFMIRLGEEARQAITSGTFADYSKLFKTRYCA